MTGLARGPQPPTAAAQSAVAGKPQPYPPPRHFARAERVWSFSQRSKAARAEPEHVRASITNVARLTGMDRSNTTFRGSGRDWSKRWARVCLCPVRRSPPRPQSPPLEGTHTSSATSRNVMGTERSSAARTSPCRLPRTETAKVGPTVPHHLTGRLSLVSDQLLYTCAHRTERNNYGSEGWGFESLRARKQSKQNRRSRARFGLPWPVFCGSNNIPEGLDQDVTIWVRVRKLCTALRDHLSDRSLPAQ